MQVPLGVEQMPPTPWYFNQTINSPEHGTYAAIIGPHIGREHATRSRPSVRHARGPAWPAGLPPLVSAPLCIIVHTLKNVSRLWPCLHNTQTHKHTYQCVAVYTVYALHFHTRTHIHTYPHSFMRNLYASTYQRVHNAHIIIPRIILGYVYYMESSSGALRITAHVMRYDAMRCACCELGVYMCVCLCTTAIVGCARNSAAAKQKCTRIYQVHPMCSCTKLSANMYPNITASNPGWKHVLQPSAGLRLCFGERRRRTHTRTETRASTRIATLTQQCYLLYAPGIYRFLISYK